MRQNEKSPLRILIQLVLIASLLLSGNTLAVEVMPCCEAALADMQMQPAASASSACHDANDAMPAANSSMSMSVASMLQCPRSSANAQVSSEWKSDEQAEPHVPLVAVAQVATIGNAALPADRRWRDAALRSVPPERVVSISLPLRI